MMPLSYNFRCQFMSDGFCSYTKEPACYFDCNKRTCENCIDGKAAARKSPCCDCYMSINKRRDKK